MTECNPFDSSSDEEESNNTDSEVYARVSEICWSQCHFMNIIGIQCSDICLDFLNCCSRHRCSYICDGSQCKNVVSCRHKWYCVEHGQMCRCQYVSDEQQCQNTIYYHIYATGSTFCIQHKCCVVECHQKIGLNDRHLCFNHYKQLYFCEYINDHGGKCINIIDNPFVEVFSPSQMSGDIKCKMNKFCQTHVCKVYGCYKCIRNDQTLWCDKHSLPCQYQLDGQQCSCFYHNSVQYKNRYCDKHQCHWNPSGYDDERCLDAISLGDESNDYCEKHYKQFIFTKYEYYS